MCGKRYLFFLQAQPYVNKDFVNKNVITSHFRSHLKLDTLDALMCMSLFGIEVDNRRQSLTFGIKMKIIKFLLDLK
jgi:hypothetical protein